PVPGLGARSHRLAQVIPAKYRRPFSSIGDPSMTRLRHLFAAFVAVTALAFVADSVVAKGKHHHQDGKKLLGEKIKKNGKHTLDKKGNFETNVEVANGKITAVKVKHAKKGEVPVKKYKTSKKMVDAGTFQNVAFTLAQAQYI